MADTSKEAVERLAQDLRARCNGTPSTMAWPHYVLHDSIATLRALSAENEALRAALKEAMEWNWIDHEECSDDPHCVDRIPSRVVDPIIALTTGEAP